MASVRYIILAACQNAGLDAQAGWESEAAAWIKKQGDRPCAYVSYGRGQGVAGFDNVSVVFGGSDPRTALRRVRDSLERSLEFRSERQTEVGGFPALVMTARSKRRVYGVFGGGVRPTPPTPTENPMYFEAVEANSTVALMSSLETAPNLEYSTDGVTWQEWQHTTADGVHTFDTLTLTAIGDRVYLRGDNPDGLAFMQEGAIEPGLSNFVLTGAMNGGGNIISLLDADMVLTEVPRFGFVGLFAVGEVVDEPVLLTPPSMDTITTIGEEGCYDMYFGCTSLTSAADMPQLTTIGDNGCFGMYGGCTSLTAAADMPLLTTIGEEGCYDMYFGCTSLTSAADMPQLTTIGEDGCFGMYEGCTSLIAAANMPQLTTIGEEGCGDMYFGCTSLTAAADMPLLTTIGEEGCYGMYGGCTSLIAAANMPQLTTIGDNGCFGMYNGCTSLTAAADMPLLTTIGNEGCKSMYAGCTSLTAAADMPSLTTIGESGCSDMYTNCTSLTAAADMPLLTTIGDSGCDSMYADCTFNMSDDGTTLNFDFPTPPITAGETTFSTAYDVAEWMGNINGFTNP